MSLEFLFAFVMVVAGSAISGAAAFGFSLLIVPPLLLVFEPASVTTMVIVLTLTTRWLVLVDAWDSILWKVAFLMAIPGFFGSFAGAWVLSEVNETYIKLLASLVAVMSALMLYRKGSFALAFVPGSTALAGFFSGFLNTATGMASPPVVILSTARGYTTQIFRGTLTAFFYLISTTGFIALVHQHLVGKSELAFSLALLPAAFLGTYLGQRLTRRVRPETFRSAVLVLLLVTGCLGGLAAIRDLIGS